MVAFLFWNLRGNQEENRSRRAETLIASLRRLTAKFALDVLVFAECAIDPESLIAALNEVGMGTFHYPLTGSRIHFFTRIRKSDCRLVFRDRVRDRMAILRLKVGRPPGILLAGAHFHDRMRIPTPEGRALATMEFANTIAVVEDDIGHQRTVLLGDLNMNPFEAGVVGAGALHAVLTKELAESVPSLKARSGHRCFYNPMWGCFGDRSEGPPGTYFFENATDPANHFWQIYDQVLVRPELINALKQVRILDTDGEDRLVTESGRSRKAAFSDHLPLLLELAL